MVSEINTSYPLARSGSGCGVVYVNQADANRYSTDLLAAVRKPEIWNWLVKTYTGANPFGQCGGMNCIKFISQITTTTPVCAGDRYVNPLMTFAIALSEGGIVGENWNFYGCGITSFERYIPEGTVNGLACTATTANGQQVINPALVARNQASSVTTQVLNSCINETGGANPISNKSAEDGLACFITYAQGSCVSGRNDAQVLSGYEEGGNPQYGPAKIDHLDELATQITRAANATGVFDAEVDAAQMRLRQDAAELRQRLTNCQ